MLTIQHFVQQAKKINSKITYLPNYMYLIKTATPSKRAIGKNIVYTNA